AVPEHERKLSGIDGQLVGHERVIAVKRLSVGVGDHTAADGETALFLDGQRLGFAAAGRCCTRRAEDCRADQEGCFQCFAHGRDQRLTSCCRSCEYRAPCTVMFETAASMS